MRITFVRLTLMFFLAFGSVFAQPDSLSMEPELVSSETETMQNVNTSCLPNVSVFEAGSRPQIFCINDYTPTGSYCSDLQIRLLKTGVGIRFRYNKQKVWSFEGTGYQKDKDFVPVNVEVTSDAEGRMSSATVFVGVNADTMQINIIPRFSGDRVIKTDSLPNLHYAIQERKYLCIDKPEHKIIDRKFTYPTGYMRRGPQFSYPELYWFHHGTGVTMPTSASVRERGELIVQYNILNPPDLKYDDMEEEIRRETWKNKILNKRWQKKMIKKDKQMNRQRRYKKQRGKKEPRLKIKPIR